MNAQHSISNAQDAKPAPDAFAQAEQYDGARRMKRGATLTERFRRSLSSKLLALTILFVFLAELIVLIPAVSSQRLDWLHERLEAAYLVGIALDAPGGEMIESGAAEQIFATANILGVTLDRDGARMLILTPQLTTDQARVMRYVNLNFDMPQKHAADAWATMFSRGDSSIRVVGEPTYGGGNVDMIVSQAALRRDLLVFARNVLLISLVISSLTAALVFWSLNLIIVRPIERLTQGMMAFEKNPEDASALIEPGARIDEIGVAERGLASMERRIQTLLIERRRLAALGSGISKISHDLRNILASAQLMSDRLAKSEDPSVRKLTPRLISSLDRAIALSRDTLSYARMEPSVLKLELALLHKLGDDVLEDSATSAVALRNEIDPALTVRADPTQLYRALFNLVRNSIEALAPEGEIETEASRAGEIALQARRKGPVIEIDIVDNGPGVPEKIRETIFEPFKGSKKPGGTGLGVAIAAEIARAHGGSLVIAKTDATGATFRLTLPAAPEKSAGQ